MSYELLGLLLAIVHVRSSHSYTYTRTFERFARGTQEYMCVCDILAHTRTHIIYLYIYIYGYTSDVMYVYISFGRLAKRPEVGGRG